MEREGEKVHERGTEDERGSWEVSGQIVIKNPPANAGDIEMWV